MISDSTSVTFLCIKVGNIVCLQMDWRNKIKHRVVILFVRRIFQYNRFEYLMFVVKREPKTHWNIMTQYSLYKIKTDLTTCKFHKSSKKKVKAINTH